MTLRAFWLFGCLLAWWIPTTATGLDLTPLGSGEPVGRSFTWGIDSQNAWDWDRAWAASKGFAECHDPLVDFGYSAHVYWLRMDWTRSTQDIRQLYLTQWSSMVGKVDVRFRHASGWTDAPFFSGSDQKADARLPRHFPTAFPFPTEISGSVLVRLESVNSLSFLPMITDDPSLAVQDAVAFVGLGLVSGFLFLMVLFNLFMLITVRDRLYLWYTLYLVSFLVFLWLYTGFLQSLLAGYKPFVTTWDLPIENLLIVTGWIFASQLNGFGDWRGTRWVQRFLFAAVAIFLALDLGGDHRLAGELTVTCSGILVLGIEVGAALKALQGAQLSRYFLVGWSCLVVSVGWMALGSVGIRGPFGDMTTDAVVLILGLMLETTVFSAALAARVRGMQRDLELFQQKAAQADRLGTLGLLTAQVGHELNTPNHVISLNASLLESLHRKIRENQRRALEDGVSEPFDAEHKLGEADPLVKSIVKASGQINQVLTNLRAEVRPQDLPVPIDLGQVIRQTAQLYEVRWKEETTRLSVHTPPVPVMILGVDFRLQQLVVNLVSNALHALTHRDQAVTVRVEAQSEEAVLTVKDEGQGMTPEVQAKLGTPFFSTRRTQDGTGLGWGLCQEIVKEHQGRLEVSSQPGVGTTVTVRLVRR